MVTAPSPSSSALMNTYARAPFDFERGEGAYLFDATGRRYLDFYAGIAVNSMGHAHPHLVAALEAQARKLWHISNAFPIAGQEILARRLADSSFADRVFFTNSGVEALEGMIKLARRYHHHQGNPQRWRIITLEGAFHGRSLATIAAAGNPKYLDGFGPQTPGFDQVPFGNMNALRAAITEETAAILVEPIQGEGGIRPLDGAFMQDLRRCADEYGLLLILDEVQCGNGRTGKLWAHEWAGIVPDALATAKGLGGGFPVGAILASEKASQGMEPGVHGTTFGGNPLAMAVGNAVMDLLLEEGFLEGVHQTGHYLEAGLAQLCADYPAIFAEVRGHGLILGLVCNPDHARSNLEHVAELRKLGLLTIGAARHTIRLLPPLIITTQHCDEALTILRNYCQSL